MEKFRAASMTAYVLLVIAILLLVLRNSLFANGFIAIVVQGLAALIMLWARLTFGRRSFHAAANPTEGGLVISGPYRFLRHPIYASILYFIWAGILSHLSLIDFLIVLVATAAVAVRIIAEERFLSIHYPEYISYAARTKRVIPFLL